MLNSKDFAKRLGIILDFYGLTASALADEIDFNRSTISHLISGRNKPSLEFVMKLLQRFAELDMDWLVLGKGSFPSDRASRGTEGGIKLKSAPTPALAADLFSESKQIKEAATATNSNQKKIDRIVVFYTDGTFKLYEN